MPERLAEKVIGHRAASFSADRLGPGIQPIDGAPPGLRDFGYECTVIGRQFDNKAALKGSDLFLRQAPPTPEAVEFRAEWPLRAFRRSPQLRGDALQAGIERSGTHWCIVEKCDLIIAGG